MDQTLSAELSCPFFDFTSWVRTVLIVSRRECGLRACQCQGMQANASKNHTASG